MREKDSCSFKGSECNSAPFVPHVLDIQRFEAAFTLLDWVFSIGNLKISPRKVSSQALPSVICSSDALSPVTLLENKHFKSPSGYSSET